MGVVWRSGGSCPVIETKTANRDSFAIHTVTDSLAGINASLPFSLHVPETIFSLLRLACLGYLHYRHC